MAGADYPGYRDAAEDGEAAFRSVVGTEATDTVIVYRIAREIESAEAFGFLELFLSKDLLENVRKLITKRPDFGFVDWEEEFIREAIRQFLHRSHTSLRGPELQLW